MKKRSILLRFDDICPTMNWEQWEKAKKVLDSIGATAMLGVIPDNQDPALLIDKPRPDFWEYIKLLQAQGYTIAMHGYHHIFDIQASGLSTPKKHSEFAGHPFDLQNSKIKEGNMLLKKHDIKTDVFFAPAHSYDDNTLKALYANGFKYMSDGKSLKPYMRYGIECFPELTGGMPKINGYGNYFPLRHYFTSVFHVHEWAREGNEGMFNRFKLFCQNHKDEIVPFDEYKKQSIGLPFVQRGCEVLYTTLAALKHSLLK